LGRVSDVGDVDADRGQGGPVEGIRGSPRRRKVDPEGSGHGGFCVVQESEQEVIGAETAITSSSGFLCG